MPKDGVIYLFIFYLFVIVWLA